MLGYTTVSKESITRGRDVSKSWSGERRALILPRELKAMGTDKEVILFADIPHPVKCDNIRYYEERRFTARLRGKVDVSMLTLDGAKMRKANALVASASVTLALAATASGPARSGGFLSPAAQQASVERHVAAPEIAPNADEISKRFLAFIGGLTARSDATFESFRAAMGVAFDMKGREALFGSGVLPSGIRYLLVFYHPRGVLGPGFSIEFTEVGVQGDLKTKCPLPLEQFSRAVIASGYNETIIPGDIGQVLSIRYTRGYVALSVRTAVVQSADDGSSRQTCVQSITMFK